MSEKTNLVLPLIVGAQFAGTSLWFAGNAVLPELQLALDLPSDTLGDLTSAVQFGFITGTLFFAFLAVADRFSPSRVFLVCSLLGAASNLAILWLAKDLYSLLALRMFTGFMLAGIYPVGMKIAADYHQAGLGKALGYLLGALVLGTAFPHLLRAIGHALPWSYVLAATALVAASGGLILFRFVPDGPYRRPNNRPQLSAFFKVFAGKDFRSAALGYFGHMWEVYTFWAFVPVILGYYGDRHGYPVNIPLYSFGIIAIGSLGCVAGGYWSQRIGNARVAFTALTTSGLCCLLAPWSFQLPWAGFLVFVLVWGLTVAADSPQFSTIVARTASQEYIGSALTLVNCIGFAITIGSIQVGTYVVGRWGLPVASGLLAIGPVLGLAGLFPLAVKRDHHKGHEEHKV